MELLVFGPLPTVSRGVKAGYNRHSFRFHRRGCHNFLTSPAFSPRPALLAASLLAPLATEAMIRTVGCATHGTEAEMIGAKPTLTVSAGFLAINTYQLLAKGTFLDTAGVADRSLTVMAALAATGMNPMLVVAQS